MHKAKTLSLILLVVAISGIMVGSSGSTSISTAGSVSVDVVNDEHAYIGYQSSDLTVRNGTTINLVSVTNRLTDAIYLTDVAIVDGSSTVTPLQGSDRIGPGESVRIRGTVDCTPNQTKQIALRVIVKESDITMQLFGNTETREFTLNCAPPLTSSST